jgi:hypothetical protein
MEQEVYRSSNGDRWFLVSEPGSDRMFVRHQPNLASGGQSSLMDIDAFLAEGHGPQHEALLRLLQNFGVRRQKFSRGRRATHSRGGR